MINPEILGKLSKELNLPEDVVKKAYIGYWLFIRTTIKALPLKDDVSEEEFSKLKTNFNLPSLGKLACTQEKFSRLKQRYKHIKKLRNGTEYNKG